MDKRRNLGDQGEAQVIEGEVISATPYPLARSQARPPRLGTIREVRREMAKVYADMRLNKIDPSDGAKLVYVLTSIAKAIEMGEIEARLNALELATEQGG